MVARVGSKSQNPRGAGTNLVTVTLRGQQTSPHGPGVPGLLLGTQPYRESQSWTKHPVRLSSAWNSCKAAFPFLFCIFKNYFP